MKPILYRLQEGEAKPDALNRAYNSLTYRKNAAHKLLLRTFHPRILNKFSRSLYEGNKKLEGENKELEVKANTEKQCKFLVIKQKDGVCPVVKKAGTLNDALTVSSAVHHAIKSPFKFMGELVNFISEDLAVIENATNQIEKREFSQVNLPKLKEAIRSSREWLGVLKQASDSNNKDAVRITEIFARMSGSAKPKLETMTSDEVKQFLERLVAVGSKSAGKETSVSCQMNSACLLEKDYIGLVVENFVSNALKYGGKKIDILAEEKENKFIFSVTDNGEKGISKETLAAIFQTKETNTKMGSNGVGLPVSDIIAKLVLGGSIRAVSEPGSTTFALEIPLGK